jgi:toxin ParE1/3/4
LSEIVRYIAADSPRAAYAVHDRIREATEILTRYPSIGRSGRVRGTRELVIPGTPFVVPYRLTKNAVTILRIMHGAEVAAETLT